MTPELIRIFWAALPSFLVGVALYYFTKKQNEKDKEIDERADMRKRESLLTLKMTFANGKLAHATAIAVKNGKMNGELADAEKAYKEAVESYNEFVNETHAEMLKED